MPKIAFENPLDKFASYSIHHILLACRTTEEAKAFMDNSDSAQRKTLDAIEKVTELGGAVPLDNGNNAFLVIDTRRFAQFSVEKLEYEVLINGLEKQGSHGNLATTIAMTVTDAVGISFINFIQWLMDEKMQSNFDGMIFMYRVIFVGHTPNGKTETVQSVTIPMHLFKMELNLDATKGTCDLQFMPNMNFDVKQHRRWLTIHDAAKYFSGKGINTLGAMIDSFENQLNKVSSEYYMKVQKTMNKTDHGRKVVYQITIPDEWRRMALIGAGTADSTETNFIGKQIAAEDRQKQTDAEVAQKQEQEKADKASGIKRESAQPLDTIVSVETDRQITEVLDFIFKQVPEIADLGVGRKTVGKLGSVTFYKHFVGITSDEQTIKVHIDVVPFTVPNMKFEDSDGKQLSQTVAAGDDEFYQTIGNVRRPKNWMEFDYIFTGKNKEVLNFDLKFQDLQFMLASQLNRGPGVEGVVENAPTGETPVKDKTAATVNQQLVLSRKYDAILVPRKTEDEKINYANYTTMLNNDEKLKAVQTANDYMTNLSMYYAMAPIVAMLTIRGNPNIMTKFNQNHLLDHDVVAGTATSTATSTVSSGQTSRHHAYRKAFEEKILQGNVHKDAAGQTVSEFTNVNGVFRVANTLGSANYATSPVFVTVNVMGPNVQHYPGQNKVTSDFATRLLMDSYYVVFKVKNLIEGNVFTQDLELYSHNIFGVGKATALSGR